MNVPIIDAAWLSRRIYPVLTLTQPWASLLVHGHKHIETRSWGTPYRGQLLIHAAKHFPLDARQSCKREPFRSALADIAEQGGWPGDYHRGCIIGMVDLEGCDTISAAYPHAHRPDRPDLVDEVETAFGNYKPRRFAWVTANPRRFATPIPAKGQLGIWHWRRA